MISGELAANWGLVLMRIDKNKSPAAIKASVGTEPCLQCTAHMQDFCRTKRPRCDAFQHYVETGVTPEMSAFGWVVD